MPRQHKPNSSYWERQISEVNITYLESRIHDKRWCAYHGTFHELFSFTDQQRLARYASRYCKEFGNPGKRAKTTLQKEVRLDELRRLCDDIHIILTDDDGRAEASARGARNAVRNGKQPASSALSDAAPKATKRGLRTAEKKTAKKARKTATPAAERVEEWSDGAIDKWFSENLCSMNMYDVEFEHETAKRDLKGELFSQSGFANELMPKTTWMVSLSEVRAPFAMCNACFPCPLTHALLVYAG
jgi:hypothetical protein